MKYNDAQHFFIGGNMNDRTEWMTEIMKFKGKVNPAVLFHRMGGN